MNIGLVGYGKMGKAIESIALSQGHSIKLKIGSTNQQEFTEQAIKACDVIIEFSTPNTVVENLSKIIKAGVPVVCGTTAWLKHLPTIQNLVQQYNGAFIYASNFSIGVNIFFEINKQLARIMQSQVNYIPSVEEIHHTAKLDAPSGTAITIAQGIIENYPNLSGFVNEPSTDSDKLSIISKRLDPAPGTHSVSYKSLIDDIQITHTAHSRDGFASGAVLAATFLFNKKGIYTMQEVLGL